MHDKSRVSRKVTDLQREYLTAFDEFLARDICGRDFTPEAAAKESALRDMIADAGLNPDDFLRTVPLEPRGQQNTPRNQEKIRRRAWRRHSPKEGT
jgi:hypothetical protein